MALYGDPQFERHVAVSQMWGLVALGLADDAVLPFDFEDYAAEVSVLCVAIEGAACPRGTTAPRRRVWCV